MATAKKLRYNDGQRFMCNWCWEVMLGQKESDEHKCPVKTGSNLRIDLMAKLDELRTEYEEIGVNESHFVEMLLRYTEEHDRYTEQVKTRIPPGKPVIQDTPIDGCMGEHPECPCNDCDDFRHK